MSAPTKEERETCWKNRDQYHKCLENNNEDQSKCLHLFSLYTKTCRSKWIEHFERTRAYQIWKEKKGKEELAKLRS